VDGKEAAVGLDSFARVKMVAAEMVADRRDEWRPSKLVLQGVAQQPVRPLGEIDLNVKLGDGGAAFVERAAICEQLPAGVDVLVGHDTLREQGLVLERDRVLVGGSECRAARGSRWAVAAAERAQEKAVLKQAKKMLRVEDPVFRGLESRGQVECVEVGSDGSCIGYRVRLPGDERAQARAEAAVPAKPKIKEPAVTPQVRAAMAAVRQRSADERRADKRYRKEQEWKLVEEELEELGRVHSALAAAVAISEG
jgi:hypothetical protein